MGIIYIIAFPHVRIVLCYVWVNLSQREGGGWAGRDRRRCGVFGPDRGASLAGSTAAAPAAAAAAAAAATAAAAAAAGAADAAAASKSCFRGAQQEQ